jgi:bifunctional ADP-heptose synthase (sugar kinase/adenylyltransferase)
MMRFANAAAGIVVSKIGTAIVVSARELERGSRGRVARVGAK